MHFCAALLRAALLLLALSAVRVAQARTTTVLVAAGPSAMEARVVERLWAELRSAGYQVYAADPQSDTSCAATAPVALSLQAYGEAAWTQLSPRADDAELDVRICYRDAGGRLAETAIRVSSADVDRSALATVEALNGLRAQPSDACAPCAPAPAPPTASLGTAAKARPARSALAAGAGLVFDPQGIGPIVGATGSLKAGLSQRLGLTLDVFVPVRAQQLQRADRNLTIDIAWCRFGPTLSWPLWQLTVNASLAVGPALVWADASAVPPLVGSSERTAAAVFSAGGSLELPRDAAWFLRAYYEVGGVLPRIQVTTGERDSEHFGPLLFQLGAALGVSWES